MNKNQVAVGVHIRWMIRRDMNEVMAIENQSWSFPWSEEDFLRYLRQRNCIGMVAERGETIVGFMVYELHKSKLHILNMTVHPDYRHKTVGRQMVEKLISKLSSHRRFRIAVDVRESCLTSQLFFKNMGFKATKVRREFYLDSGEDAYAMVYRMATALPDEEFEGEGVNRVAQYEDS